MLVRLLLLGLVLLASASSAHALPAPDAATLAQWRGACDSSRALRIVTLEDAFESPRVTLDSAGVRLGRLPGHHGIADFDTADTQERHIEWSEIQRIQRSREGEFGEGFVVGALVGGVLGGLIVSSPGDYAWVPKRGIAVAVAILGAGVGTLVGLGSHHWATIVH